jgi:hypothetical protein
MLRRLAEGRVEMIEPRQHPVLQRVMPGFRLVLVVEAEHTEYPGKRLPFNVLVQARKYSRPASRTRGRQAHMVSIARAR